MGGPTEWYFSMSVDIHNRDENERMDCKRSLANMYSTTHAILRRSLTVGTEAVYFNKGMPGGVPQVSTVGLVVVQNHSKDTDVVLTLGAAVGNGSSLTIPPGLAIWIQDLTELESAGMFLTADSGEQPVDVLVVHEPEGML